MHGENLKLIEALCLRALISIENINYSLRVA